VKATALLAGAIAFYASARSLQLGPGVEVIALTSVAANLVAITGGILVFHEPIGSGPLATSARVLAFCLVIVGAALMPVEHAAPREPGTGRPVTASASQSWDIPAPGARLSSSRARTTTRRSASMP
jgi:hypothetical protein